MAHKEIPLTSNKVTIVDEADYDWLMQWKWTHHCANYAYRTIKSGDTIQGKRSRKTLFLHRFITVASYGEEVDHIDGNGLNNTRLNLRKASRLENGKNRRKVKTTTSKYKGIYWNKYNKKWLASLCSNKKRFHLGLFDSEISAAKAYNEAALKYHGEFARLNLLD